MKTVLTIAGSDSSGGAGIQADLKTMCALGLFGMSAITAITAQNTQQVKAVQVISPEMIAAQIDAVYADIPPDAVKIGMVPDISSMQVIRDRLIRHKAQHVILDPVMVAKSGSGLLDKELAREWLLLVPIAELITPNVFEAEFLGGHRIIDRDSLAGAAKEIQALGAKNVLVKGGALTGAAEDFLLVDDKSFWLTSPRIATRNTHGTGCTLSAAIACFLARGFSLTQAVEKAKAYVVQAINAAPNLGSGSGPLGHMARLYAAAGMVGE